MANEPMDFEDKLIAGFGYKPQFKRVLSLFADFSLGYSYMSPMAGFYALFAYALTTAGPAYFWTIPVILGGQILVAFVLAEAASSASKRDTRSRLDGNVANLARTSAGFRTPSERL